MNTPTVFCDRCHVRHAMFWVVGKEGKRTLSYRCTKVLVRVPVFGQYEGELRHRTKVFPVPDHLVPKKLPVDLPEEWKRAAIKAKRAEIEPNLL